MIPFLGEGQVLSVRQDQLFPVEILIMLLVLHILSPLFPKCSAQVKCMSFHKQVLQTSWKFLLFSTVDNPSYGPWRGGQLGAKGV